MKKLLLSSTNEKLKLFVALASVLLALSFPSYASAEDYVVIVNKQNPTSGSQVKKSLVRNIFLLNKKKWRHGARAKPVFPAKGNKSYDKFLSNVLRMKDSKLNQHWLMLKQKTGTSAPPSLATDQAIINMVSKSAGGIGVVSKKTPLPDGVKILMSL